MKIAPVVTDVFLVVVNVALIVTHILQIGMPVGTVVTEIPLVITRISPATVFGSQYLLFQPH